MTRFTLPVRDRNSQLAGLEWIVTNRDGVVLGAFLAAADAAQFATNNANLGRCAIGHAQFGWVDMFDRFGTWEAAVAEMLDFVRRMVEAA